MADIGTAYVRIAPNMTGISGKIAAGMKGQGTQATNQLSDEINSNSGGFQGAIGKLGSIAKVGGLAIATGLAAGAAGIAALTGKALMSGAELEQQLGGAEAVFGQYADGIKQAAEDAFATAGLSQTEFLQGANKMGSLFQGAGFDVQSSMKMSSESMQRASDIASIMGISTTDALEAVTGMAKGNFTMMDNLGVAMNDTAIAAYAASKGINKSTQAMSIQEKVGLAQQMFMEKTAKYAGNYAKENQTLAGSLNSTKKAFDNLLSGQGDIDGFIELLVNTIELAVPAIVNILPKIVQAISATITALVPALSATLPVLLPAIITAAIDIMNSLVAALPQIIQVLVGALPMFINGVIQIAIGILKALPQIIAILTQAIPQIVDSLVTALTNPESLTAIILGAIQLFVAILQAIPVIITALIKAVPTIVENIIRTLTSPAFIKGMLKAGVDLIKATISGIVGMVGGVLEAAGRIIGAIGGALSPSNLARVGGDLVKGLWNGITDLTGWIVGKIKGFGDSVMSAIKGIFGIHSPSTEWAWVGKMDVMGLAKGMLDNIGLVKKASSQLANAATTQLGSIDTNMSAGFNSNVNTTAQIVAGQYESAPKVVQYNEFNQVAETIDVKQISSDLGYAVAMA